MIFFLKLKREKQNKTLIQTYKPEEVETLAAREAQN